MTAPQTTVQTVPQATVQTGGAPVQGGSTGRVARLAAQAADAARVRELTTDPDVIALRVERVRTQVDALLWAGIVLGLGFTMVNVQTFAADGSPAGSPGWWVAWLLDPMVSLVLLAVLRAEQVTARYQVALPAWARRTKWLTFAATYVMNTWTSWGLGDAPISAAGIVLHSVPPLVVFATAETGPVLRDRLTEAVHRAAAEHGPHVLPEHQAAPVTVAGPEDGKHAPALPPVHDPAAATVHDPGTDAGPPDAAAVDDEPAPAAEPRRSSGGRRKPAARPRRQLADYVRAAHAELDARRAVGEDVDPSPTWCRQVTGCSAGTSVKVAAALRDEHQHQPQQQSDSEPETRVGRDRRGAGEEVAA